MTDVVPVTPDRLEDLADLFDSTGATRGCWCMAFIIPRKEYHTGRRGGNREAFERLAQDVDPPMGLLGYRDGVPVAWCSIGPRSRYSVATGPRSVLRARDASEDNNVWLVPCFFVRVGHRRNGLTCEMLTAAVDLARKNRVRAVEGWPIADSYRGGESFEGREHVFDACGFTCIDRPSPRRAIMRLDLTV